MGNVNKNAIWPGWDTIKVIGAGNFGTVYEIRRDVFGTAEQAALKMISIPRDPGEIEELYNEGYDEENITAHFRGCLEDIIREYSMMLEIRGHSNVVYCDDIQYKPHEDGIGWDIFIKMELLNPLTKWISRTYDERQVVKLGIDICRALQLCRQKKIVHRDIKPQNIFISPSGDFKLGDFGVAKISDKTAGGTKIGTYEYMAPEVYNNRPYGAAADLYSLGIVLYWMMNNRRGPFLPAPPTIPSGTVKEEAYQRRFSGEALPPPANGSDTLKSIVLTACDFDPKKRFRTPDDMLAALLTLRSKFDINAEDINQASYDAKEYVQRRIYDAILANFYSRQQIDLRADPAALERIRKASVEIYAAMQKKHTVMVSLPEITGGRSGPVSLTATLSRDAVGYGIAKEDALLEQALFDHIVKQFRITHREDLRNNLVSVARVWIAVEKIRLEFYKRNVVQIQLNNLVATTSGPKDLLLTIERDAFRDVDDKSIDSDENAVPVSTAHSVSVPASVSAASTGSRSAGMSISASSGSSISRSANMSIGASSGSSISRSANMSIGASSGISSSNMRIGASTGADTGSFHQNPETRADAAADPYLENLNLEDSGTICGFRANTEARANPDSATGSGAGLYIGGSTSGSVKTASSSKFAPLTNTPPRTNTGTAPAGNAQTGSAAASAGASTHTNTPRTGTTTSGTGSYTGSRTGTSNTTREVRTVSQPTITDPNIRVSLTVTLEEVATGCDKELRLQRQESCPDCSGRDRYCKTCRGTGVAMLVRKLLVSIPAGIDHEQSLRLHKQGQTIRGKTGDLLVKILVQPHPRFLRKGTDIYSTIPVPENVLLHCGTVQIPTLYGPVNFRLPENTRSGDQFVIAGYGIQKIGNPKAKGNHCFTVVAQR